MTPDTTPPSREQFLCWLHEAAEIEHDLMCYYLYAAFSGVFQREVWTAETGWSRRGARSTVDFMALRRLGLWSTNHRRGPHRIAR
jgi:hypothetical protein